MRRPLPIHYRHEQRRPRVRDEGVGVDVTDHGEDQDAVTPVPAIE
ncbi:MAG: hypothetical protein Q8T13_07345 [Acidobacteriota bacterium]|nr:hypothetical protein [Acidobacteriota bacterium]